MPTDTPERLAQLCRDTAALAVDAANWLDRNKEAIGAKFPSLRRDLKRREMLAKRYERSARRPVGVGVFGASQAGKSYLVSALARKGASPLTVVLDRDYDFLKEINPEDNEEATGLVTRFTVAATRAPDGFPVRVQLLNQIDLIKILANTYFLDFDPTQEKVPPEAELDAALNAAEAQASGKPTDGLADVEIDDLRRYFVAQFSSRETARLLNATQYWTRLELLAPRLRLEERIKLYAYLWGGLEQFSAVYRQLYSVLESLGFADECFCAIEALSPRETSIINVKALAGIADASGTTISVRNPAGQVCSVPRAHLTAIVAELVVQMKDHPWEFLEHTDLLDFPGARTREINDDAQSYVKKPGKVAELFRRGKVAYLFDRYCDENELSGMLLCLPPGNQEVRTIPGLMALWIKAMQGGTPAMRAKRETSLFVVLTKFDRRFEEAKGRDLNATDWTAALKTPLADYFGATSDNWTGEWHPGKAFDNVFWLRNPNFIAPALMTYSASKDETGIADFAKVERLKQTYLANDYVRRHFRDPETSWNEAFRLNDGGISFLANALAPVCRPELKREQIAARVAELRAEIAAALAEYHISGDAEAERQKRILASQNAVRGLSETIRGQRFGHMLSALQIGNEELQYLFRRLSVTGEVSDQSLDPDDIFGAILDAAPPAASEAKLPVADKYMDLAHAAFQHWAERSQQLAQQENKLRFIRAKAESIEIIVREVLASAERQKLPDGIAADMRAAVPSIEQASVSMLKAAMTAAEGINGYVWKLGQDRLPPDRRAQIRATKEPVFKEPRPVEGIVDLPENRGASQQIFIRDWLAAFLVVAEQNAGSDRKSRFPAIEASTLGKLMGDLAA